MAGHVQACWCSRGTYYNTVVKSDAVNLMLYIHVYVYSYTMQ